MTTATLIINKVKNNGVTFYQLGNSGKRLAKSKALESIKKNNLTEQPAKLISPNHLVISFIGQVVIKFK